MLMLMIDCLVYAIYLQYNLGGGWLAWGWMRGWRGRVVLGLDAGRGWAWCKRSVYEDRLGWVVLAGVV